MFCPKCGKEVGEGMAFCPYCGNALQNTVVSKPANSAAEKESDTTNATAIIGFVVSLISLFINMWGLVGGIAVVVSVSGLFGCLDKHQRGAFWAVLALTLGGMGVLYAFHTISGL